MDRTETLERICARQEAMIKNLQKKVDNLNTRMEAQESMDPDIDRGIIWEWAYDRG